MKDAKGHGSDPRENAHQTGVNSIPTATFLRQNAGSIYGAPAYKLNKADAQKVAEAAGHSVRFERGMGWRAVTPQGEHGPFYNERAAWRAAASLDPKRGGA